MYKNYNGSKKRRPRYKNSVSRSSGNDAFSVTGLRIARIVVGVLIVALVIGIFVVGSAVYRTADSEFEQSVISEPAEINSKLISVVNKSHKLGSDYVPELIEHDAYSVSGLADEALSNLLAAAEKDGVKLDVQSAYVSYGEQEKLYRKKLREYLDSGLSEVKAQAKTEARVPQAGCSEAQTGLLVTFKTDGNFEGSKASRWLSKNAVGLGFVLRYPADKTSETSMNFNPKVYRYVGVETAQIMRSLNKCLDEYYVYINSR